MVSFLFWNIFKKPLQDQVARLVRSHEVDILMLAECDIDLLMVEEALRRTADRSFTLTSSSGGKTPIFTRLSASSFTEEFTDPLGGLTIRQVAIGRPPGIILAVAHLPSRASWDGEDQNEHGTTVANDIIAIEEKLFHRRTILVGDLNMNPWLMIPEQWCVGVRGAFSGSHR